MNSAIKRPCEICGVECLHHSWPDDLCTKHHHTQPLKKFNGGRGALVCNICSKIISTDLQPYEFAGDTYLIRCPKHLLPHKFIHKWWDREEVAADNHFTYLFGDNINDSATGYVPRATQAVIRGLPNSVGIPTKKNRGGAPDAFFEDTPADTKLFEYYLENAVVKVHKAQQPLALPFDGIGTGAAQLFITAPKLFAKLNLTIRELLYECR